MANASVAPDKTSRPNLGKHRTSGIRRFFKQIDLQLMVLPALVLVFIFAYIPMYGILIAFQDYKLGNSFISSDWVGLKHFIYF